MKRSQLSALLFGATALALVTASAATAQQATGQDATPQQAGQQTGQQTATQGSDAPGGLDQQATMHIQQQLQDVADALEQEDAGKAQQALQQADQQIQDAMRQAEGDQQHAMSELQQQVQEATQAIDGQDTAGAQAALDQARTKLQEIRSASSDQAGQDQQQAGTGSGTTTATAGAQQDTQQAGAQAGTSGSQQETQQAMDALREHLEALRQAVEQQDFAAAEHHLQEAEMALGDAQMAAAKTGDVAVTAIPADQQGQAAAEGATREPLSVEETNRLLGLGDREVGDAAERLTLTPLDLFDRDVITMDGEEVGEVEDVVTSAGTVYAIVEHGGFLGIGQDRVAIPLERIGIRGDEVILLGLTEEQLEAMPEYDFEGDEDVADEQSIEIGRYE